MILHLFKHLFHQPLDESGFKFSHIGLSKQLVIETVAALNIGTLGLEMEG